MGLLCKTTITRPSEYLTVAQLAKRLQISERWLERDYIPYLMAGYLLRFDPTVINSWMTKLIASVKRNANSTHVC